MSVPVSVLIITRNEEANLRHALDSVASWAQEVFVVDSYSEDATVAICREYAPRGVRLWQHPFENYAAQRNWALENLPWSSDWVFFLDADEIATAELKDEIRELLASGPPCAGYVVTYRFIFLGRWLRHASTYPVWLLRLFRRSRAHFTRSVNERLELDGTVGRLQHEFIHHNRAGLSRWLAKHNVYSSLEAEEYARVLSGSEGDGLPGSKAPHLRRQRLKGLFIRLPVRPLLRFLYMCVWKRGFLDGRPGLIFCMLKAIQEFHISCKIYENRLERGGAGRVRVAPEPQVPPPAPARSKRLARAG
jgi:glycosyltransferase involved in cell wall biosynthesis